MTILTHCYGYMRVSTEDQSLELQRQALVRAGVGEADIRQDMLSGKSRARPGLEAVLAVLQPGDTLVVWKLDRLARSVRDLKDITEGLQARGVTLRSVMENIDTSSAAGKLFFHMLAAFAEFERETTVERTKAGLAATMANGTWVGRLPAEDEEVGRVKLALARGMGVRAAAAQTGLSAATVSRIKRGTWAPMATRRSAAVATCRVKTAAQATAKGV